MYRLVFRHIVSTDFIHTSKKSNTNCEVTHSLLVQNQVTETKNAALVILPEYNSEEVNELQEIMDAAKLMDLPMKLNSTNMPDMNAK